MDLNEYNYELPKELIAKYPTKKRDESRLIVTQIGKKEKKIIQFKEIINELDENIHLVFNDTKVIQARLFGRRKSGASFEILLEKIINIDENIWKFIGKNIKRIKENEIIIFNDNLNAKILSKKDSLIQFDLKYNDFDNWIKNNGHLPLPPYIINLRNSKMDEEIDKTRYQTVYAKHQGAVAAPTAGLHFTDELLTKIKEKNITFSKLILHVGLGTFMPIKTDNILEHKMHSEEFIIDEKTANEINEAKKNNKKIIAVGTTSLRALESSVKNGNLIAQKSNTELFVYPGYKFKIVDGIITNFHLPKSTLLLLIAALYGKEELFELYNYAIKNKIRFYSYGDSMFLKPKN